jgi:hypothetical protein
LNYEWYYFLKDVREHRNDDIPTGTGSVEGVSEERAIILSKSLGYCFRRYWHSEIELRRSMNKVLKLHTEICQESPGNELLKRRHNALVYKYIVDTVASDKVIASKLEISKETLY